VLGVQVTLKPGDRVVVTVTDEWSALELYGATGRIVEGENQWGSVGVLLDPEHDPWQLVAAFKPNELEKVGS
jgi:hypothetical protein